MRARIQCVGAECNDQQCVIRDCGDGVCMTVTNDAESVVAYLLKMNLVKPGMRLFYYDSENNRDEILFDGSGFKGFVTERTGFVVMKLEPGRRVYCDLCCREFTDSNESGGFFGLGTKAVGPCCATRVLAQAVHDGEEHHIKAMCPTGVSFADWVRSDLR